MEGKRDENEVIVNVKYTISLVYFVEIVEVTSSVNATQKLIKWLDAYNLIF